MTAACAWLMMASIVQAGPAGVPPPTGEAIVDPSAKLELLFTRSAPIHGGLTEGPAAAPDGTIYFSDIPFGPDPGMILKFDPRSGQTSVFTADSGKSNGLAFAADGSLVACEGAGGGGRRVSRWNVQTGERTTIADRYQGKRFNAPNDLCIDRQGRIYFSDPKYVGDELRELEHMAVYRIDADGVVHEVTHAVSKPNGVALAPDGKTLYVAEHDNGTENIDPTKPPPPQGAMKIHAFTLDEAGNATGPSRVIVDFGKHKGCDGMTVDRQGHVYLTQREPTRPGVKVIDPAGNEVAFIPTGPPDQRGDDPDHPPVGLPSNVEFGTGDDAHTLYVTVDVSLYRIRLKSQRGD